MSGDTNGDGIQMREWAGRSIGIGIGIGCSQLVCCTSCVSFTLYDIFKSAFIVIFSDPPLTISSVVMQQNIYS